MHNKRLIYILSSYSVKSANHFAHVLNLLDEISQKDVKVALIIEKCDSQPNIDNVNITVYAQKEKNKIKRVIELFLLLRRLIKFKKYDKVFIRISSKAAIVSIVCSKLYGAKTYYWQSGAAFEIMNNLPFLKRITWFFSSFLYYYFIKSFVDYFATGPETMVQYYIQSGKVKKEKMILLYNDVDNFRFFKANNNQKHLLRKQLNLKDSKIYILLVHRFSPIRKTNYYLLPIIDYFKKHNNICFLLIGNGPDEKAIGDCIHLKQADNFIMLGSKPNSVIQNYYMACDIFINPSYCEGFPRVIIEAMSCGLPVIATDVGGTKDLFGSMQSDFVVNKDDVANFIKMLQIMIDSFEIRKTCSHENLYQVVKYSTKNVADMYVSRIWENAL